MEGDEPKVTASYAIFPKDGGNEAPGSVVGFQFSQARMAERFREITSKVNVNMNEYYFLHFFTNFYDNFSCIIMIYFICFFISQCNDCLMPCSNDLQDCYVIDNNGYIVISERDNDTGKFFGEVEGSVLQALVDMEIFKVITVYDLQALCEKYDKVENYGETLNTVCFELLIYNFFSKENNTVGNYQLQPLQLVILSLKWAIAELVIFMSRINIWVWSYARNYLSFQIKL